MQVVRTTKAVAVSSEVSVDTKTEVSDNTDVSSAHVSRGVIHKSHPTHLPLPRPWPPCFQNLLLRVSLNITGTTAHSTNFCLAFL